MHRPGPQDDRPFINRAPNTHPNEVPRSAFLEGPAIRGVPAETPTTWTPYVQAAVEPYQGKGHDELHGRLMDVEQGSMYDPTGNPWPNNGQFDRPNGFFTALLRLKPHTSAHPGASMPAAAPGPTMLFHAPPIFSVQTQPIVAVGA